ncbi:MAG: hypothetical protein N4A59_02170 [Marinifilum sp.]|jgi:hypothetical protein|nr:hypothetical protein [Marinifilum sp.]
MKKKNRISLLIGVFVLVYLVVDVFHFISFRIDPVYPTLTEAFFESSIISIIKWLFCLVILIGYALDKKARQISFYLMLIPAVGITTLFILKGQLMYLIRGSFVFSAGLLELTALLIFIYSIFTLIKKYKIKTINVILSLVLTGLIFGIIFYQLPIYSTPPDIGM